MSGPLISLPLVEGVASVTRARLIAALATVPPLTCADCGALVPLERATTVQRGPVAWDLCPACAAAEAVAS